MTTKTQKIKGTTSSLSQSSSKDQDQQAQAAQSQKKIRYEVLPKELTRLGDWIRWAASRFKAERVYCGHGTDNEWDEAVQLVLQLLHLPVDSDPLVFQAHLTEEEQKKLLKAIKERIINRKPLPYITHQAWFMGLSFYVDERVLIPRSPLAEWIAKEFQPWIEANAIERILDIGTGSACLAIACAVTFPKAKIDAVDIDKEALEVAKINIRAHQADDQINLMQSDCFQEIQASYDVILSNPPYVSDEEMVSLPKEYLHEPTTALRAADQGLEMVLKILLNAKDYLNPNGLLIMEVGNAEEALLERFPEIPFVWLEQANGGQGLFLLTKEQLEKIAG